MSVQELSLSRIAVVAEGISTHAERNGIITSVLRATAAPPIIKALTHCGCHNAGS